MPRAGTSKKARQVCLLEELPTPESISNFTPSLRASLRPPNTTLHHTDTHNAPAAAEAELPELDLASGSGDPTRGDDHQRFDSSEESQCNDGRRVDPIIRAPDRAGAMCFEANVSRALLRYAHDTKSSNPRIKAAVVEDNLAFLNRHHLPRSALPELFQLQRQVISRGAKEADLDINERTLFRRLEQACGMRKLLHCVNPCCEKLMSEGDTLCRNLGCPTPDANLVRIAVFNIRQQVARLAERFVGDKLLEHSPGINTGGRNIRRFNLAIGIWTDGVRRKLGDPCEVWPVYMFFECVPLPDRYIPYNMAIVAVGGTTKPDFDKLLRKFTKEWRSLHDPQKLLTVTFESGDEAIFTVELTRILGDRDMFVKLLKGCAHNCKRPCFRCKAIQIMTRPRHLSIHQNTVLRTNSGWRRAAKKAEESGNSSCGIAGRSIIFDWLLPSVVSILKYDDLHL